jgi:hypothetical protein
MTFKPEEYDTKQDNQVILHENDDKLDFSPSRLRLGTASQNGTDAHNNGKYDDTKTARKPVASYINGVFEQQYESIHAAVRYLRENEYPKAAAGNVSFALRNGSVSYDRTWKRV